MLNRTILTTTDQEIAQIAELGTLQKRYLSRRICALCEHPMDLPGCGSFYEACPEDVRLDRRAQCLNEYKPRQRKKEDQQCHAD